METQIIDKLYLELSQITNARNSREILAENCAREASLELERVKDCKTIEDASKFVKKAILLIDDIWKEIAV